MRRQGLTEQEIEGALLAVNAAQCVPPLLAVNAAQCVPPLLAVNAAQCVPPLPEEEVRNIAHSIGRYPPGQPTGPSSSNGRRPSNGEPPGHHPEELLDISPSDWEQPLPFTTTAGPGFPTDALPEPVRSYVIAQATELQTPVDLPGTLGLGVGAAACADRAVVRVDQGWSEPLNEYFLTVLSSGEKKSPSFRRITRPLEEREQELVSNRRPEVEEAKVERDILDKRLHEIKTRAAKAKAEEAEELKQQANNIAQELTNLVVPKVPRLITDDATSEAVISLLTEQGGRIAVMSTVGGLFENLAGKYSEGHPNFDVYLKGHSGDPIRVDRKARAPEFVQKPALTLVLTVQPDVIRDLASKRGFRGRGLLARFKYSIPQSMVGYRSIKPPITPEDLTKKWDRLIKDILKMAEARDAEEHAIDLSPGARESFQAFRQQVEDDLRPGAELSDIADWGNKLSGTVARLAGILHMWKHCGNSVDSVYTHGGSKNPRDVPIGKDTMESAVRLGEYFKEHVYVAFGLMGSDKQMAAAQRVWEVIQRHGFKTFSVRDLWQHVRRSFNNLADLREALQTLESMTYVRPVAEEQLGKVGRPPSQQYQTNPLPPYTDSTELPGGAPGRPMNEDPEDAVSSATEVGVWRTG